MSSPWVKRVWLAIRYKVGPIQVWVIGDSLCWWYYAPVFRAFPMYCLMLWSRFSFSSFSASVFPLPLCFCLCLCLCLCISVCLSAPPPPPPPPPPCKQLIKAGYRFYSLVFTTFFFFFFFLQRALLWCNKIHFFPSVGTSFHYLSYNKWYSNEGISEDIASVIYYYWTWKRPDLANPNLIRCVYYSVWPGYSGTAHFRCEQMLFVYVLTAIPPRLSDSCNFITVLLVTREPELTTLLFWSAACSVTPHVLHTADRRLPPVRAIFKFVFSLNFYILTACLFTCSLFT